MFFIIHVFQGIEKETEKEKVISWLENTDQKKKKMPFKKGFLFILLIFFFFLSF